jgi:hypothetical protein
LSSLRAQTIDLAAQERDLQLIDNAIEQVVPHINGDVLVQTEEKRGTGKGEPKLVIIKVEEWQARMRGFRKFQAAQRDDWRRRIL